MDERGRVNASGGRVEDGPEVPPAAPRFDDKSVQRAQPAVPLAPRRLAPTSPVNMVAVCLVAALAGAFAGALALKLYLRDTRAPSTDEPRRAAGLASTSPNGEAKAGGENAPAANKDSGEPGAAETLKAADGRGESRGDGEAQPAAGESSPEAGDDRAALRGALGEWVAATNARDIGRQMTFYDRSVGSFYLSRNVTREAVRAEKSRVFSAASTVEIRAADPDIRLGPDGRTAVMRFRKRYRIAGGGQERRGEVLQELRWRRTPQGWKIVGERDLRVLQ